METYSTYKLGNVNYQLELTEPIQVPATLWVCGVNVVRNSETHEIMYEEPVVTSHVRGDDMSNEPQLIQDIFAAVFK